MKNILSPFANAAKLTYGTGFKIFAKEAKTTTRKYLTKPIFQTSKSLHTQPKWQANYEKPYYISSSDLKYLLASATVIGFVAYHQSPNQKLYRAIIAEDIDKVKDAIEAGADVNKLSMFGRSALHYAAMIGNANITEYLINVGANLNQQDPWWKNAPLMFAILCKPIATFAKENPKEYKISVISSGNHDTVIRLLVRSGADCNVKNKAGVSALHALAATHSDQELIVLLIQHGADLESKDRDLCTPLHWAAAFGSRHTCKTLIEAGAQTDAQDVDGNTPLDHLLKSLRINNLAQAIQIDRPIIKSQFDMSMLKIFLLFKRQIPIKDKSSYQIFARACDVASDSKNIFLCFSKWATEDIAKEKSDAISLFPESPTQINQYLAEQEAMLKPSGQEPNKPTDTDL